MSLIAEDLLLLLLDDRTGELRGSAQLRLALGGAMLSELALERRIEVEEKRGFWHSAKVRAILGPPTEPILAEAHAIVAAKERSAQDLVNRLGKGLKSRLLAGLVSRGIVREARSRLLGLIPRTRWHAVSPHARELRGLIDGALLQGQPPAPRIAALVSLLHAIDQVHKVIPHPGVSNRELKKRAKAVAEGDWAAKGVRDAVAATSAAIIAATAAPGAAAAGSS